MTPFDLEQLRLGAESKATDIPFRVSSLIRIHDRVVELEASAELQALDHRVVVVLVPIGELPDRVERRRLLLDAFSLRRCCGRGLGSQSAGDA